MEYNTNAPYGCARDKPTELTLNTHTDSLQKCTAPWNCLCAWSIYGSSNSVAICTDIAGMKLITSVDDCERAFRSVKELLPSTTVGVGNKVNVVPPGCSIIEGTSNINFNDKVGGASCSTEFECLCERIKKACTCTNGIAEDGVACMSSFAVQPEMCKSCLNGYTLDSITKVCVVNECKCLDEEGNIGKKKRNFEFLNFRLFFVLCLVVLIYYIFFFNFKPVLFFFLVF